VLRGGGLQGLLGYDDGVYFGAAIALTHGYLPYRDVLLLHPPGIVLLLAPFAVVGEVLGDANAMALARIGVMALGAINTLLAGLVAGRFDRRAGLLAAALYATWSIAVVGERSPDLHGPQHTLLLIALAILSRRGRVGWRRAMAAGAIVGLAMTIQLWQAATFLVLAWWVAARAPVRGARVISLTGYVTGAAIAVAVVIGPFLAAAPQEMVAQVVMDQIGRPHTGAGIFHRLIILEGGALPPEMPDGVRRFVAVPVGLALAAAGLALLLVTARRQPWTRPWIALVLVQATIVLSTPSFFPDYPAFLAPAAALSVGTGLSMFIAQLLRHGAAYRPVLAAVALGVVALGTVSAAMPRGRALPLAGLDADVAAARCVSADSPALLVLTGAMRRNAEHGCALVVDPTGVSYDAIRGQPPPLAGNWRIGVPAYQQAMTEYYAGGDMALFVRLRADQLTAQTRAAIRTTLPFVHRRGAVIVRSSEHP
jgi:alpha-1,2-mannosyltransferase